MHQDKLVARILLIFSVTNIVLAAPVVVRQRHLDVARAAPQKRGPISDNEETGDSPPESSSPMPPHDGLTNGGAESSSAAANHHVSWAPGLDNEETDDLPPEPSSRMPMHNGLTNGWAESSSMATNHITTQVSGAPGLDNGETGDLPHVPPHTSPTDEWAWLEGVEQVSSPEWSSEASDRITTQAPEEPGLGNGAMGNLLPESSSPTSSSTCLRHADELVRGCAPEPPLSLEVKYQQNTAISVNICITVQIHKFTIAISLFTSLSPWLIIRLNSISP
jgi:hypothetical protein